MDGNGRTSIRCQGRQRRERDGGDWINRRWHRKRTWKPRRGLEYHFLSGHWVVQLALFVPCHFDLSRPRQGRMRLRCLVGALSVTILTPQRLTRISCMTLYDMIRWARVKGRWRGFFCILKEWDWPRLKPIKSDLMEMECEISFHSRRVVSSVLFLILT